MVGQTTKKQQTGSLAATALVFTYTIPDLIGISALKNVMMKFSSGVTGDIVVTLDSIDGAAYDVVLKTQTVNGATSFVYAPEGEITFHKGDILQVDVPKTAGSTYGLTANFRGV